MPFAHIVGEKNCVLLTLQYPTKAGSVFEEVNFFLDNVVLYFYLPIII